MSQKSESKDAFEFPFDIEKVFEPNYFSKLSNWQQEIVSFYTRRFEAYSQTSEQLASCRKPQDVFEFQTKFYNELFSDYRKEAAVISELLFDISRPIVEKLLYPARKRTKRRSRRRVLMQKKLSTWQKSRER